MHCILIGIVLAALNALLERGISSLPSEISYSVDDVEKFMKIVLEPGRIQYHAAVAGVP